MLVGVFIRALRESAAMNGTITSEEIRPSKAVMLVALCLVALTSPLLLAQAPQTFSITDTAVPAPPKPVADIIPSEHFGIDMSSVGNYVLPPMDNATLLAEDLANPRSDGAIRYGVRRDVGVLLQHGTWSHLPPNVFHWAVDITSPNAIGMRLRLNLDLPERSFLLVYSPSDPTRIQGPYSASGPFDDGQVWTPTTFGDTIRVEFLIAAEVPPDSSTVPFIIDRIQHIYQDPLAVDAAAQEGGCLNDVTCYPSWATTAKAVAGTGFISGNSLFCTGQLLTSQNGDMTPYLLTANHCIGNNSTAQTVEIYWLFQSSTCNGAPPSLASVPQSAVTTLLATKAGIGTYDFSLLMVEGTLPAGLSWAGWNAGAISNGTDVTGVHHPSGTYKRISFGDKIAIGNSNLVQVAWTDGPTEAGSSGSGLFLSASQQLIGQLSTGSSFCGLIGNNFPDQYGAFSKTYPDISSLLTGGSDDAFENNDTCAAASAAGDGTFNNLVVKSTDEDWYSINVPAGNQLNVSLGFTHAYGDIDMKLFNSCGGSQIAVSETATNNEALSYTNSTGSQQSVRLRVYLFNDTRNDYSLTVSGSTGGGNPTCPGTGDCCADNGTPGCSDDTCCQTICACDPYCCDTEWDEFCSGNGFMGSGCGAALLCASCSGLVNDNCAAAIAVGEGSFSFDTTGATTDGPNEPGPCTFFSYSQIDSDIWYRYTPSCTSIATFSLCSSGYDTKMAIYAGGNCPTSSSAVACNDDACGPGQGLQSQTTLSVVAGNTYLIRIGGYQGATGSGMLSISCAAPPACQPNLGFQGPGTATLTVCGDLSSGGTGTFTLTGAPSNVPAYLVYSLSNTGAPFAGGTLLPFPNYFVLTFSTNGVGDVSFNINGGGGPLVIYSQFAIKANPNTWWLSNAVALTLLP
jgi:hypothetical protein